MIRKELGLSTNAFILVYTGQMIERKNVDKNDRGEDKENDRETQD